MKWLFALVLIGTSSNRSVAQAFENEKVIYLDADGNPAKKKKAVALEQIIPFGDTAWEFNFYRMYGALGKSFRCSDPEGKMLNGRYSSYSFKGHRDTSGQYKQGQRSGRWYFYTTGGRIAGAQLYRKGQLVWTKDTIQLKREEDSLAATRKKDTSLIFQKAEIESEFIGGSAAWLSYLNHHLQYPDDEVNKEVQGTVIIGFIVDKAGHIESNSIWVDRSVDYGIDAEAIRVILSSAGSWTPAIQNGLQVRSYKKQPIVFGLRTR
jgi:hypothetical protein